MYMYIPLAMSHHVMRKLERNYLTGGCYFQRDEERGCEGQLNLERERERDVKEAGEIRREAGERERERCERSWRDWERCERSRRDWERLGQGVYKNEKPRCVYIIEKPHKVESENEQDETAWAKRDNQGKQISSKTMIWVILVGLSQIVVEGMKEDVGFELHPIVSPLNIDKRENRKNVSKERERERDGVAVTMQFPKSLIVYGGF